MKRVDELGSLDAVPRHAGQVVDNDAARNRTGQLLAAAFADHGDDILTGWVEALEPAAAALVAAAEAQPSLDLRNGHDAATHGGEALRHWASARTALDAWTAAERGFYALAAVAGIQYTGHGPLALTPARKAELERIRDGPHGANRH